jgi:hypothetical protein
MNARQFYDLVVELRKAQKIAATTLKYEEIERVAQLELCDTFDICKDTS